MSFSFKSCLFAGAALSLIGSATAQIQSGGLGELDPWGVGYLSSSEPSLPKTAWQASISDDLLPLMKSVRTRNITPAERALLRRAILSPARAPGGERNDSLLAARANVMFELGEARAAADLMDRLSEAPDGIVPEELAVDLQFALGQVASACSKVQSPELQGDFWLKMRAVCFALEGNQPGAELAIELARASDIRDEWLFSAVEASFLSEGSKPTARFDTGYALTISVHADLPVPINAVGYSKPHLAAAMAIRPALPPELRVLAAGVASEAGLVTPEEQLAAYEALLDKEGFRPNSPVEAALVAFDQPGSSVRDRARHLATALQGSRGSSARFYAVSRLLAPAIKSLAITEDTLRYAPVFAAALLAVEEPFNAYEWAASHAEAIEASQNEETSGTADRDAFESLWLMGISVLGGLDIPTSELDDWTEDLIGAANTATKKQAAARLMTLMVGKGAQLGPTARTFLASQAENTPRQSERTALLNAAIAAGKADAIGEASLYILKFTKADPESLHARDLLALTDAMTEMGLADIADDLLMEATGLWKESL